MSSSGEDPSRWRQRQWSGPSSNLYPRSRLMPHAHAANVKNKGICPRCHSTSIRNGCCSHLRSDGGQPATGICPECNGLFRHSCCSFALEQHWAFLPKSVKNFILNDSQRSDDGFISISNLVEFWSSPSAINLTQRTDVCSALWYLSLVYSQMGMVKEARSLCINGSFIHQCILTSIEYIMKIASSGESTEYIMSKLNYCAEGFYATETPEKIERYIGHHLPPDYQLSNNITSKESVMSYVNQINDDYSSTKKNQKRGSATVGESMKLILEDETGSHELDVISTNTLKMILTEYAENRGISIRKLRFSMNDKTLFLSQVGNQTLEELELKDKQVISARDTTCKPDPNQDKSTPPPSKKEQKRRKARAHAKKKSKGGKKKQEGPSLEQIFEKLKIDHSKKLTKIHDELQPQLKEIRQRLNNLTIERKPPKTKQSRSKRASMNALSPFDTSCITCVDNSKAGISHFVVNVSGEPSNLFKTSKKRWTPPSPPTPSLDLHGLTKDQALVRLDEALKMWIDAAQRSNYPFVVQAKIICGCGNQILSETVQDWIKQHRTVSRAPKTK